MRLTFTQKSKRRAQGGRRCGTPVERPRDLAGKAVFTEAEAAEFEKRALQTRNVDLNRETTVTERGVINGTIERQECIP